MEALFIFIAKASGLTALFYFAYYFLLRKETFFTSSRWFLLAGLLTSVILPFIIYTKVIWIDPAPVSYAPSTYVLNSSPAYTAASYNANPQGIEEKTFEIDWNMVSIVIYTLGFAAFMLKFAIDFYSLNSVLKGKKVEQQADFKFIDINENIAPFSYFDYIVYNSSLYSEAELQNILEHEKVHSDQHHTIDVLISRIFCILFWFNPIIWLYKKAILQNLEFIADSEASKKIADKKAYQYTLLKITTHDTCVAITNHFYQSLIKKRIVMLNKNQSKKWNYWKYYAIIPALGAFVLSFQIKTIAQEKKTAEQNEIARVKNQDSEIFKITKSTTDQELKDLTAKLKTEHNVDIAISDLKRNSKNEITGIKVRIVKENGKIQIVEMNGNNAIKDCNIVLSEDEDGSKDIALVTGDQINNPPVIRNVTTTRYFGDSEGEEDPVAVNDAVSPVPPVPPVAPSFPSGPMPPVPAIDMSKMPKPPKFPKNHNDKTAMDKFNKEMAEFERKMEAFEPDLSAYEKQLEAVMSQREAIFEKQMEQYEIAMEQFNTKMEKFNTNMKFEFDGFNAKEYEQNMKQYEKDMKQYELDMKQHEKDILQHAKDMKQHAKDMKKQEKDRKAWEKENKKA
ncbi:M56 family metallopeptidase [Flavobacterium gelatinilyticum]|uniref:M56 family metallopeptidase n=1 Tax=Flavobacterium gelatinilyticum TaxID=3003260 RepID=UPI0024819334|nr:M56 family metallopeptidase [Flavobacterium gelatinilyticum]